MKKCTVHSKTNSDYYSLRYTRSRPYYKQTKNTIKRDESVHYQIV